MEELTIRASANLIWTTRKEEKLSYLTVKKEPNLTRKVARKRRKCANISICMFRLVVLSIFRLPRKGTQKYFLVRLLAHQGKAMLDRPPLNLLSSEPRYLGLCMRVNMMSTTARRWR